MNRNLKALLCIALVALALLAGATAGSVGAAVVAKTPCWKTLLNDWYDGRIDGTYPLHCYQDALKHLPSDVATYSSARDDIERALQNARAVARRQGHTVSSATLIRPANGGGNSGNHPPGGLGGGAVTVTTPGRKPAKGFAGLADQLDPGSPSSLPLPLLILGGLAILLVAAGGVGLAVQRLRGR